MQYNVNNKRNILLHRAKRKHTSNFIKTVAGTSSVTDAAFIQTWQIKCCNCTP